MSTLGYNALLSAGAPILPEGFFYRVKSPTCIGTIRVQLRQRRKIGSKLLADQTRWLPEQGSDESAACFLAKICQSLVESHDWKSTEGDRFDRDLEDLLGDHP